MDTNSHNVYKTLTLADRSVISSALNARKGQLEKLLHDVAYMRMVDSDAVYDRLTTQLKRELEEVQSAIVKVRL